MHRGNNQDKWGITNGSREKKVVRTVEEKEKRLDGYHVVVLGGGTHLPMYSAVLYTVKEEGVLVVAA